MGGCSGCKTLTNKERKRKRRIKLEKIKKEIEKKLKNEIFKPKNKI